MSFLSSLRRMFARSASRSLARRPGRLWLECLEDRTLPSVVNWIGSSGNWNDTNNWLDATTGTNHTPTASDDAVIDVAGVTVTHGSGTDTVHSLISNEPLLFTNGSLTLAADSTLNSTLAMSNGTLAAQGALNLNGQFTWSGGTLNGTGDVEANAGLLISGSNGQTLSGSQTLDNAGTATWTGTGFFQILGNGVFNNLQSATFDDQTDASIGSPSIFTGAGTFNNAGLFVKSAGTGITYATQLTINNSGTLEAMSGTLDLAGAHDAARRGISTGAFLADAGATLEFGAGYQTLASSATVSGAGNVIFDSETFTNLHITIDGDYNVSGLTTVRDTNAPFGNPDVTFTGSVEMGALNMGAGTLKSFGPLTIDGALNWTGGTLGGSGPISANAGLLISGSSDKVLTDSKTLDNAGTATWTGTGFLQILSNGVFNNLAGATFDDQTDASIGSPSIFTLAGTFNNAGRFVKSAGTGVTYATQLTINNSGTLEVMSGTLDLAGAHDAPRRSISTGAFFTNAGTTLEFGAGFQALASTASVSGAGNVIFDSETFTGLSIIIGGAYHVSGLTTFQATNAPFAFPDVTFTGPVEMGALNMGAGTLKSHGMVTVDGALTWTGGTLAGRGQINADGGLNISGNSGVALSGVTLNNVGAATWSGTGNISGSNGAVFNNLAGASFEVQGDASFGGSGTRFNNAGIFLKSMGSGTTTISSSFDNTGTLRVASGELILGGGGVGRGSFTVNAGKTLQFSGGTQTLSATSSVNGNGNVLVSGGIVNVEGGPSFTDGLTVSGGTINFDVNVNLSALTLSGGALSGAGDVAVSGLVTWTGGAMNGQGETDANGGLAISGNNNKGLDSRTLNNAGAGIWSGIGSISGNNAVFNNLAGASIDVQGDASFSGGGTRFNNAGAFLKSMGSGVTAINTPFANSGTIDVASGMVNLTNGGASQGSFTVEAAKTLQFGGGTHTLTATSSVNGAGNVVVIGGAVNVEGDYSVTGATTISGGTINFDANVALSTLTLTSGTLDGIGDVAVSGLLTWTGGSMSGQGQTDANGSLVISSTNNKALNSRTLNNAGTAIWSGTGSISGSNGAVFNNLAGATFEVQGDAAFGDSSSVFNNAGAFFKSMGSGVTTINAFVYNTGSMESDSGALIVNNDFVNAGFLSPGGNGHTTVLTINGNYIQTAQGTLSIDLGGTGAGVQYDQLHVTGTLLLDGTLQVQLINGFSPALGNSFQVLTFTPGSVIGDFATVSLPTLDGGLFLAPTYTSTALSLVTLEE